MTEQRELADRKWERLDISSEKDVSNDPKPDFHLFLRSICKMAVAHKRRAPHALCMHVVLWAASPLQQSIVNGLHALNASAGQDERYGLHAKANPRSSGGAESYCHKRSISASSCRNGMLSIRAALASGSLDVPGLSWESNCF